MPTHLLSGKLKNCSVPAYLVLIVSFSSHCPQQNITFPLTNSQPGSQSPCTAAATKTAVPSLLPVPRGSEGVLSPLGRAGFWGGGGSLHCPQGAPGEELSQCSHCCAVSEVLVGCAGSPRCSQTLAADTFPASSPVPFFPSLPPAAAVEGPARTS